MLKMKFVNSNFDRYLLGSDKKQSKRKITGLKDKEAALFYLWWDSCVAWGKGFTEVGLPRWGFPGLASGKESHLPIQETQEMLIQSWGQEDPLEEEIATHSSILA